MPGRKIRLIGRVLGHPPLHRLDSTASNTAAIAVNSQNTTGCNKDDRRVLVNRCQSCCSAMCSIGLGSEQSSSCFAAPIAIFCMRQEHCNAAAFAASAASTVVIEVLGSLAQTIRDGRSIRSEPSTVCALPCTWPYNNAQVHAKSLCLGACSATKSA
jgi:hypothetical protein